MGQHTRFARLSQEQWQRIIEEQIESGLSQNDFCQSHQISLATFSNWKRKLKNQSGRKSAAPASKDDQDWIDLSSEFPEPTSSLAWHMELKLPGGVILRMRR